MYYKLTCLSLVGRPTWRSKIWGLRSLSLIYPSGPLEDIAVAAVRSGLKKNTTLRELTLAFPRGATTASPILTSLRDHPLLRTLCLDGDVRDLTGLETLLLRGTSKITELDIHGLDTGKPVVGLTTVLQALGRRPPTLTKLGLRCCPFGRANARLLRVALCNIPSLQSLVLTDGTLVVGLAELAPALYHNTSIKVLDISGNWLDGLETAILLRDILHSNKTITTLDLSGNNLGERPALLIALQMGCAATQRY
jgi:hypothetical protein